MRYSGLLLFGLVVSASAAQNAPTPDDGASSFTAQLSGYNEVHFLPGTTTSTAGTTSTSGTTTSTPGATTATPGTTSTPGTSIPGTATTNLPKTTTSTPGTTTANPGATTSAPGTTSTPGTTTSNPGTSTGGTATSTAATAPALRGAVSTKATGSFAATLNLAGDIIDYTLSYQGLEGNITQAHIHFGQPSTVGGIVVWLCQTDAVAANVPKQIADPKITPVCPNPTDGTVKGTITSAQVLELSAQGFAAKEFDELIRALRAGAAYVNIHSVLHPQGEIRGQIQAGGTK